MGEAVERGKKLEAEWNAKFEAWAKKNPELAKQWDGIMTGKLPEGWDKDVPVFPADAKGIATREAGNKVMNSIAKNLPWLMGGSADLETSNKTKIDGETRFRQPAATADASCTLACARWAWAES